MKRITTETLRKTENRLSTSERIERAKRAKRAKVTVCKPATNTRPQHIRVKTKTDYSQNIYRNL